MFFRNLFLVVVLSGVVVFAQDNGPNARKQLASKDNTREFTEAFLSTVKSGRTFEAFSMFRAVSPDTEGQIDAWRQATDEMINQVRADYGKAIGFEPLDVRSLGTSFVRYDYLLKFERNALHFRVVYYRPNNTWLPVWLAFSQDMGQLFDDLGK
jgi:hypothetical protein